MRITNKLIRMKLFYKNKKIVCMLFSILLLFLYSGLSLSYIAQSNEAQDGVESINQVDENKKEENPELNFINPKNPTILKGYVSKIPSGTKLKIILETPIDEVTSKLNDEVTARTSEDIVIDGNVVVPASSTVVGEISEINPAKRMHKAGTVRIEFKNLTVPDGRQVPIVASVLTRSGLVKGKFTKKTALISGATIVAPVAAGIGVGLAAEGSAVGAAIGAALGAVAGIVLFAFQRGNMVDLKAGDEMDIELVEEALLPNPQSKVDTLEPEESKLDTNLNEDKIENPKIDSTEIDFTEPKEIEAKPKSDLLQEVKPQENPIHEEELKEILNQGK